MPTLKVFNMAGETVSEVTLSESVFGIKPNKNAMFEAVKNHEANKRHGTQSALTRAEVSGGGAKPYRQKGTGRARQGSTRAPHFTHGGVAFAPKPRTYNYSLNKKFKRLALKSALSQKVIDEKFIVVDGINPKNIKTKEFKKFLENIGASGKAYIITPEVNQTVVLSARNLPGVKTTFAKLLSVYDIINSATVVVDLAALAGIEEVYA